MSKNTRKNILETAKKLFNEQGYNGVSTRDIAVAVGISKGNLTYYFKKKEDIIETLLSDTATERPVMIPATLNELNDFFLDVENVVRENAYYFWHHTQISQISPKIKKMQADAFSGNVDTLTRAFQILNKNGILRKETYEGEYRSIIDAILLASIYWIPFSNLRKNSQIKDDITFVDHAWNLMRPIMTTSHFPAKENR